MTPTPEQIMDACRTRSATDAARHLWAQGYAVTRGHCDRVIKVLMEAGDRERQTTAPGKAIQTWDTESGISYTRAKAEEGCRQLLRRQLETGAHWISCPTRMAMAVAEARLSA